MRNLGSKVTIKFKANSSIYHSPVICRNVTEIHFNYPSEMRNEPGVGQLLAVESDIHGTGATYRINHIEEFEMELETEKVKNF